MKRVFIVCLVLLLVWLGLPPIPIGTVEAATTDREDISVLSVTVNVNTKTNRVYTELILQNAGAEDTEITFALPEISAGINMDSLSVKTVGGEEIAAPDGAVTLSVRAGGNTGVSYTYTPKINLAYERAIGFDLRQLKGNFNDHIGHLEWTVDMPLYEIVLVKEIQPVLYTVEDNRISVVLEEFTVNRVLDRVCLTRTTHQDLLLAAEENGDPIHRLILGNYRNWYQHPEIILDNIVEDDKLDVPIDACETLYNVLQKSDHTEEFSEYINNINAFKYDYYSAAPRYIEGDGFYDSLVSDREKFEMNTFALYEFLLWSLRPNYSLAYNDYEYFEAPAFVAQINHEEPVVYAEIISDLPDLNGKEVYVVYEATDKRYDPGPEPYEEDYEDYEQYLEDWQAWEEKDIEYSELYDDLYETTFDVHFDQIDLNETWFKGGEIESAREYEWDDKWRGRDPKKWSERVRVVIAYEKDFSDPEELSDYLDALHVKFLVRSDIALCSGRGFTLESQYNPMWYRFSHSSYAYDGTEVFSFETLKRYLDQIAPRCSLVEREEPLKNVLSVPVLTFYRGFLYPVEEYVNEIELRNKRGEEHQILSGPTENAWLYEFAYYHDHRRLLNSLFERSVPKQIAEEREESLQKSAEEKRAMLAQVRGELGLPTPEDAGVTMIPGLVIPERPIEEPIEEVTEAPTEEATTAAVEPSETPYETGEASTTEQEPKTSSEAAESLIEASEPGASGGKWILPTAIAATVVALAATIVTVAVRKKKSK